MKSVRWLLFLGRLALGGILIYAGWLKWREPWLNFAAQIEAYKLAWLSEEMVVFIAKWLPKFEVALGVALVLGVGLRWFASLASLLLLGFFVLLVRSYAIGLDIDCGCFGSGDKLSKMTLVRDGALLAGSLLLTAVAFATHDRGRESQSSAAIAESSGGAG